jgi:hypothetical protein
MINAIDSRAHAACADSTTQHQAGNARRLKWQVSSFR